MFQIRKDYLGMATCDFCFKQVHKYARFRKKLMDYLGYTNKYLLEIC